MKLHTPLGRVRFMGAAREGTTAFEIQRLTSIAGIPLTIFLIGSCLYLIGKDYDTARIYVSSIFVAPALTLVLIVFIWHMYIGMKEIMVDYLHAPALKYGCLIANMLFSFLLAFTCVYAILRISFAG